MNKTHKRSNVYVILLMAFLTLQNCEAQEDQTEFSEAALNDTFLSEEGDTIMFSEILEKYQGKTIFIDVWAGWCRDCIEGFPKLKELQSKHSDVVFLFLSLDRTLESWNNSIKKYDLEGEHYYMSSGWDGPFGEFLDLDWIPRYMVVDKTGTIKVYRSIKVTDEILKEALN